LALTESLKDGQALFVGPLDAAQANALRSYVGHIAKQLKCAGHVYRQADGRFAAWLSPKKAK
jgi:hypothetical protein